MINRFSVCGGVLFAGFLLIAYHAQPIDRPEPVAEKKIETSELSCLALTIYGEARSESILGQKAVANVIMNRVQSSRFPDTICGVVHQSKQFSMWNKGDINGPKARQAFAGPNTVETLTALHVALWAIEGGSILPDNALNYHTTAIRPEWGKRLDRYEVVGAHLFYVDM